ncbi:MAG: sulfotransferase [Cyanobacteria bacterium J06648_16]
MIKIYHKLKGYKVSLDDWLLSNQIISGQSHYQKFIILTRARTGSNFLAGLLQSHTGVRAFEEIFPKREDRLHWGYKNYPKAADILRVREERPLEFLDKFVFRQFPFSVSAVGFKIFYNQAQAGQKQQIWQYLRQNKEIKIIHLKRRNLLRVCLSHHLATATNQWVLKDEAHRKDHDKVALGFQDCLKLFEETKEWEEEYDRFFDGHPKLEVSYEDLVNKTAAESKRLQSFLEVKFQRLKSSTLQQNRSLLAETIENYNELKDKFKDTPWRVYFDE